MRVLVRRIRNCLQYASPQKIVRRNWKNATEAQSHREKTRVRGEVRSCQLGGGVAAKGRGKNNYQVFVVIHLLQG